MSGRNIVALVVAIVVGIIVVKVIFAILGFVVGMLGWLIWAAMAGVVIYGLYRGFNNMLASGKRLT